MEWIISVAIVIVIIFTVLCWIDMGHNNDICFRDISLFSKIARIYVLTLIIGGILTLLVLCVHKIIFG